MFTEFAILSDNINQYKKSKNPFKKLLGRYLYRKLKKEILRIANFELSIKYLYELGDFVFNFENNICRLQDLETETILKFTYKNDILDIRIRKINVTRKEKIVIVYYIDGMRDNGILKGRKIEKFYYNKIDSDDVFYFDDYSVKMERIIREAIYEMLSSYLNRELQDVQH